MSEQPAEIIDAELNGKPAKEGGGDLLVATEVLPAGLPIVPLRPRPAFPSSLIPMMVSDPHQLHAIKRAVDSPSRAVGLVLVKDLDEPDGAANLHGVGVAGKIVKVMQMDGDSAQILINTLERFAIEELADTPEGL